MIQNRFIFLLTITLTCLSQFVIANLTTLQHWDPSPIYSANNPLTPPNSHIHHLSKARKKNMRPDYNKFFSFNISCIIQGATRAHDCSGCTEYYSDCSSPPSTEKQMGNFRGTPYAMGLFLGYDPKGKSIWTNGTNTGIITDLTYNSINATQLPSCLKDVAWIFAGVVDAFTGEQLSNADFSTNTPANQPASTQTWADARIVEDSAILLNPQQQNDTKPSIFSEKALADDLIYFGAYSLPLDYRRYGLRFELTADFSDHIGLTIQTGFVNIQHNTTGLISLSANTNVYNSTTPTTSLYGQLNVRTAGANQSPPSSINDFAAPVSLPNTTIQTIFDRFISNNAEKLLDADCGINQKICNFSEFSIEDMRFLLSFKHTYELDRFTKKDEHKEEWAEMLFTPYAWVGGSFAIGALKDYNQLLSLPFGNNGHASVGAGVGMMFDFKDSVEVGFEGGATHFLSQQETRPMPNHKLQRVLYPYRTKVITYPGDNVHFKAHMNAYQFIEHINFWATYEFIIHRKDTYQICGKNIINNAQIFYPEVLECCSDWRAQFINLGMSFDIQPGMQAGIVWQQPISPRNTYYPVSILATFSFMF